MRSEITSLAGLTESLTKMVEYVGGQIGVEFRLLRSLIQGGMLLVKPRTISTVSERFTINPDSTASVEGNIVASETENTMAATEEVPSSTVQNADVPEEQLLSSSPPKTQDPPRSPSEILDLLRSSN
ncbi:hypothetical protein RND81_13G105200 [Saponaria officinalis]|uniref:Uncharacterized protein n=1 Tax=Saponaria officinalis TaxID=3572 RepID=A0AAW1GW87_SAPOF